MANQLSPGQQIRRLARATDCKVTNYLTLSFVVVTLVTVACATSTPQRQQLSYSSSPGRHSHSAHKRSSTFENFEPLYERPQVYSETAAGQLRDQAPDLDAADEDFLRQLKEAARYLDDKLAERQRQQQQLAILNQAAGGYGRRPFESDGQQQWAYGHQEPAYSVLDERRVAAEPHRANSQFAWRPLNEADQTDETDAEPDSVDEAGVLVVAPSNTGGGSRLLSSLPSQLADYKLLAEQQKEQNQQQSFSTDTRYKQLLKSFLLDQAQANTLASASGDNQKRDGPVVDGPKSDEQRPGAKYTTLLEDEEGDPASKGDNVATKAAPPTTAAYGTLVYDQTAQRPAVTNSTASNGGGSIFGRLYSNAAHYLPFLAQLTNLRQGTTSASNNTATSAGDVTKPTMPATAGPMQDGGVVVPGTGVSDKDEGGQQQQAADNELHAKTNVSVSIALDKSRPGDDQAKGASGVLGNSGETSDQKQRANADAGANQDNQQLRQDDDKQGATKVKVTIDRTNDDVNQENGGKHDDASLDDNFTGQFTDNGADQVAAPTNPMEKSRRDSKAGSLKRDQGAQFVIDNSADLDVDMSQLEPATIGLGQQNYDDEKGHQVAANRYNMMKHSNLVLPIGSASDVLVRTTSGDVKKESDSLLGKYIYAPTQHYYLNSMMSPAGAAPNAGRHHALAGKHFQPGDEIYGSYGDMPMKAAYAFQKERGSLGDKSNDLYFLIMVGAFCVMAMAVVLAAGLFAYRIQQNRKSSQDTDYPTYGVVGPNNMSTKCGAASFVGGYFTGPPSGSSKSGSVKHLPDLYGIPNGNGGSDSGLNSLDKSSSNKKASSVSSLNEHHQSASSRAGSSNFMAAASQDAARMYHYQHQKQQMIISDRSSGGRQTSASDLDSEDENDDGSYTVYECPGLASAHEMEIKNPLFNDDQSP